jgi:hypothetical protein
MPAGRGATGRLIALCLSAFVLVACGGGDDVTSFRVVNDSAVRVIVYQCGNTCAKHHDVVALQPRTSSPFNAPVGGPEQFFLVRDTSGRRLGCLTVLVKLVPRSEPRVGTSTAKPCSAHLLSKGSWWDRNFG